MRTEVFSNVNTFIRFYMLHILPTESSVGFGRREEGTQHADKLQLSVPEKSRTHFVKKWLQNF